MKNIFFAIFMIGTSSILFSQTKEEIQESKTRLEKIQKLESPKVSSLTSLDELNTKIGTSAIESAMITPLLENLYTRSIGENVDGIIDVTVKKPTLAECQELAARIFSQVQNVQTFTSSFSSVAEEAKSFRNPMKLGKVVSSMNYAKNALSVLGEETLFQSKAIKSIITTLQSASNL